MGNKILRLSAGVLLFAASAFVIGCGGNSAPVGVTVAPNPAVVPLGGQQQFQAIVTGTSTTSVTWQICLVPSPTNAQPTVCSPATTGQTQMPSGFGIITTGQTNTPQGGFYTAPTSLPPTNDFLVVATSTVNTKVFGTSVVHIDSTIRVAVAPTSATIAPGDSYTFTANVTGTSNIGVTWEVNGIANGNITYGFIVSGPGNSATYTAPTSNPPGSVTITAVSGFDPAESGTAAVTVISSAAPTLTSAAPNQVGEGSAQQEIFLTGTNLDSNSVVLVGNPPTPVPTIFLSTTLLHAIIPAGQLFTAGPVALVVKAQNGDLSNVLTGPTNGLTVVPSRPAVVEVSPDTLIPNASTAGVNLVGGFFSPQTSVQCNGQTVAAALTSSQQLAVTIPPTCAPTPGQYPLIVQNSDVVAPNPRMSAVNLTVEPRPSDIATGVSASFPVGASPLGIAIDTALNLAVVANSASNTVSIVNLGTFATSTVAVGKAPTSVAIDDQITTAAGALGDHIAAVTNSGDNTVSVIDLTTLAVTTKSLPSLNTPPNAPPVPYGIGINPLTHRGLVAFQATNNAAVLDFSEGVPTVVGTVTGTLAGIGTGTKPAVGVDPLLNWALITPGGAGTITIVDLGRNAGAGLNPADFGRAPVVIASLAISNTVQGVGINASTHQALFADPQGPNQAIAAPSVSSFSMLNQAVSSIPFTQGGIPFTNLGLVAAAVNPLANIGVVVNGTSNNAYVLDLANNVVLQSASGFNSPQAVAVNPITNTAYVVNQGNNTVSVFPMATTTPNPLQILEMSPATTFVQRPAAGVTLSVIGNGFTGGSVVMLDGTAVPTTFVSSRQVTAAVPAADLAAARHYAVYVQTGGAISNVSGLTVIQPVPVGVSPIGVAVDPYLDQAVVTNSGSNGVSVVNLLDGATIIPQAPSFFETGATPYGVAILARTGQAVVGNNGDNSITVLDEKGLNNVFNAPINFSLCGSCTLPLGVTVDQYSGLAAVADTIANENICQNTSSTNNGGGLASFLVPNATSGTSVSSACVDYIALAAAIDPAPNNDPTQASAGVVTASQQNALDMFPLPSGTITRIPMQLPTGIVFDALNDVYLVADSAANTVIMVDPLTSQKVFTLSSGINPTSLDYNFNTSTLVTSNAASNTLSILAYVCPPNSNGVSNCPVPRVSNVLDVGGVEPVASVIPGPSSIAIDPRLNLAVQIDQANNRILLVPLPQ
jgi:DNA-binding beta-propeller fold protein YncE